MSFNYRKEFAKFKSEWEKQAKTMRDAGMSEETIAQLYDYTYEQFKGDRNYASKICDYASPDSENESLNRRESRKGMAEQPSEFDECFDLLEQIDNPKLLRALKSLSDEHYELFCLYAVQGYTQVEIARMTNQSKQNVCNKIRRIERFLKKFF